MDIFDISDLRLSKKSFVGFHMARDELATSSLAVGRLAAKQGTFRSPKGRLVASLTFPVTSAPVLSCAHYFLHTEKIAKGDSGS